MGNESKSGPGGPAAEPATPSVLDLGSWAPGDDGAPGADRAGQGPDPRRVLLAQAPAGQSALPAGFRLFEYRIDAVLGQGGFGIAYAATDVNLDVRVVVKEYLPADFAYRAASGAVCPRAQADREAYAAGLESFLVEARTLATFRHPNIVRVARFFEANDTAYMVLEYERGQSLKSWRARHGAMPEAELVPLLAPLLDGLALVHEAGYLHRDIKPENLYVRDADGSLVLLDFGAARQTGAGRAEAGMMVTPGYAPLEQYAGGARQGPWTDIYSLGATLYWMVTGQKPLEAPARLGDPDPQPAASLVGEGRYSAAFLGAIDWALARHPDDRPQDVAALRSMLFGAHAGALGLEEALRRGEPEEPAPRSRRRPAWRVRPWDRAMWRPSNWPLAAKMTAAMVLTALCPLVIAAYVNFDRAQRHVTALELASLEQLAQSTAGRISQLLNDVRALAAYAGGDVDFVRFLAAPGEAGAQALTAKLEGLARANPDIQFGMVMDTAGRALVATDPQVAGRNFAFREYFRRAMLGEPHMTGIVVGSVAGAAGVFYSQPVFDADQRVIGAVVVRLKADPIVRILAATQIDRERLPFLIDGDGVVVWHPDESVRFKSLAPLAAPVHEAIVADQRFRRASIESLGQPRLAAAMVGARGRGHVSYYSRATRRDEIAGYAPVPGHDWVVGISESRDRFTAPIERLFWGVVASVVVVGAVFVALALAFARSIVRPIESLTAAAHALKEGDYGRAHVEARSGDEIGRLARTFNVMIDVLRQRERERGGRKPPRG